MTTRRRARGTLAGVAIGLAVAAALIAAWEATRPPPLSRPGPPATRPAPGSPRPVLARELPFPEDVGARTRARLTDLQAVRVDRDGAVVTDDSPRAAGVLTDGDPLAAGALRERLPEAMAFQAWVLGGGDPGQLPAELVGELERTDALLDQMQLPALFEPLLRLRGAAATDAPLGEGALPNLRKLLGPESRARLAPLEGARGLTRVALEALDEASLVLLGRKRIFRESEGQTAVVPSLTAWGFRQSLIEAQATPTGRIRLATWLARARDALRLALLTAGRVLGDADPGRDGALADLVVAALDHDLFLVLFTDLGTRPVPELLGPAGTRTLACSPAGLLRSTLVRYQWWVAQTRVVAAAQRARYLRALEAHREVALPCVAREADNAWVLRELQRTGTGGGLLSDLEGDLATALSQPPDDARLAELLGFSAYLQVQRTDPVHRLVRDLVVLARARDLELAALREFLGEGAPARLPAWVHRRWDAVLDELVAIGAAARPR